MSYLDEKIASVDLRTNEQRTANCMRLVQRNLDMVEHEAHIKLKALVTLTAMYIITEMSHMPWKLVKSQSFKLFRGAMDEVKAKMEIAQLDERKAND